jgi:glycosyltransferase involved in cell wall biosynthesis
MDNNPLVSIIIPTYNSEKTIEYCLISIKNQIYNNIEIILVDGGSQDNTVSIAKKYIENVFILKGAERSPSINFGIKNASGKYVYRVDSDVVLDANLVNEAINRCEIDKFNAVSVMWSPDPTISFWAKVRKLEKDCYKYDLTYSGIRFLNRDLYNKLGGFNENLVAGEDYDFSSRLLKIEPRVAIIDSQELHLGEPKSIINIIKKQYFYGKTYRNYITEYRIQAVSQLSPFRLILIKNWKKFMRHPILTIGFIIYEFTIYTSTLAGYIVSYLPKIHPSR